MEADKEQMAMGYGGNIQGNMQNMTLQPQHWGNNVSHNQAAMQIRTQTDFQQFEQGMKPGMPINSLLPGSTVANTGKKVTIFGVETTQ